MQANDTFVEVCLCLTKLPRRSYLHAYAFETEYVHTGFSGVACAELMPSFPTKGVRSESVKERCKDLTMNVKLSDKQLEIMSKAELSLIHI